MSEVKHRHERDSWKDALFVGFVVLVTALSVGSVTSKAQGKAANSPWTVTVVDSANQPVVR
jgi:hypothetical protein